MKKIDYFFQIEFTKENLLTHSKINKSNQNLTLPKKNCKRNLVFHLLIHLKKITKISISGYESSIISFIYLITYNSIYLIRYNSTENSKGHSTN